MQKTFLTLVVSGLASLVLVAPGFAGDGQKCKGKGDRKQKAERRMDKIVSFSFHQSGGFMGMDRQYDVKLADLSAADRDKLEQLIKDSGLLKLKSDEKLTRGAADMFVYQFSVDEGNQTHAVTFDDGTLPESYRPLIDHVKDKMVDNRKR